MIVSLLVQTWHVLILFILILVANFYLLCFYFSSISKASQRLHESPTPFLRGVLAIIQVIEQARYINLKPVYGFHAPSWRRLKVFGLRLRIDSKAHILGQFYFYVFNYLLIKRPVVKHVKILIIVLQRSILVAEIVGSSLSASRLLRILKFENCLQTLIFLTFLWFSVGYFYFWSFILCTSFLETGKAHLCGLSEAFCRTWSSLKGFQNSVLIIGGFSVAEFYYYDGAV